MARPGSMEITKRDGMLVTLVVSLLFMTGFYFVLKIIGYNQHAYSCCNMVGIILVLEKMDYLEHVFELFRAHRNFALLLVIAYILALPFLLRQGYLMHILILICIYATICLGINFQMGSTDMVNFAPAAFFGVGAYTSAMLTLRLGISPWLGFIGAIIMGVLIGYIVGAPTLKTKSYYLSLVTIAMQTIFYLMLMNTKAVGGPNGLPGVPPFTIGEYSFRGPFTLFGTTLPYQTHYFTLAQLYCCWRHFLLPSFTTRGSVWPGTLLPVMM
jgi:branched-chain amino acid transport system permease protein